MNDGGGGKSRKGLILILVVLAALVVAAVITGVALATRDDDERKERALSATAVTGFIVFEGAKVTATGTYQGTPGGKGAVLVTLVPQGNLLAGKPVPLKGNVKIYLDGGRFTATLKGTATPLPEQRVRGQGDGEDHRRHWNLRGRDRLFHLRRRPGNRRDRRQAEVRRHDRVLN